MYSYQLTNNYLEIISRLWVELIYEKFYKYLLSFFKTQIVQPQYVRVIIIVLISTMSGGCTGPIAVSSVQSTTIAEGVEVRPNDAKPRSSDHDAAGAADCDERDALIAVGEIASPTLVAAIKARSRASMVRVLRAGEGATREFIGARVNIQLDRAGRIADIRCG